MTPVVQENSRASLADAFAASMRHVPGDWRAPRIAISDGDGPVRSVNGGQEPRLFGGEDAVLD